MIKNKDLYSTSQSATSAYYEARAKNETYKTIVGWLFDEAKDEEAIKKYAEKTADEFVGCLVGLCNDIVEFIKQRDEALQGEDEPNPKKTENLCSTCKHGIKVPKSKQPTFRCRRGWNIIVHSCKECDEYERR